MLKKLVDKLYDTRTLKDEEFKLLIEDGNCSEYLFKKSDEIRRRFYSNKIYTRGLIEISNYCKNDCLYCGIRHSNDNASRYRLSEEDILDCCVKGYKLGFRTFVLQGGEDGAFTDELLEHLIGQIKSMHPDCAVTLSLGERSFKSYERLYHAGADRYLLRHETADSKHYSKLHPPYMSCENRKECLLNLKKIGYQVGSGFMVGSPFQTTENLISDLRFLQELSPDMIGIGPFIPHRCTPFRNFPVGDLQLTLRLIAILRLCFPYSLIPATTALGTIDEKGREMGILSGANVVMPNLSPGKSRKLYELYNDKICTGEEAAECRSCLAARMSLIGYELVTDRGDVAFDTEVLQ